MSQEKELWYKRRFMAEEEGFLSSNKYIYYQLIIRFSH